jgi:hypothetical protein
MYTKYKVNLVVQFGLDIKDSVQFSLSQNNAQCAMEKSCLLCHPQGLHITLCGFFNLNPSKSNWPTLLG